MGKSQSSIGPTATKSKYSNNYISLSQYIRLKYILSLSLTLQEQQLTRDSLFLFLSLSHPISISPSLSFPILTMHNYRTSLILPLRVPLYKWRVHRGCVFMSLPPSHSATSLAPGSLTRGGGIRLSRRRGDRNPLCSLIQTFPGTQIPTQPTPSLERGVGG